MTSLDRLLFAFCIILSSILPEPSCLTLLHLTGPQAILSGSQAWVELTCTFKHSYSETQQLDLKWYYSNEEEPFLQWVPSAGRDPQIRGKRFSSSMTVKHHITNTTNEKRVAQVLRLERPTTHLSGDYHCRVSTFTHEERRSHTMTVFDPGVGPQLKYSEVNNQVNLSCHVEEVFPEPELELDWHSDQKIRQEIRHNDKYSSDMTTTTIRRGFFYSVTVHTVLTAPSLSHQTIFSCYMAIPGTNYSLSEKTIFFPGTQLELKPRASQISGADGGGGWSLASFVWIILAMAR